MKTDTLFYQIFQIFPELVFQKNDNFWWDTLLLELGLSVQEIATRLDLDIALIRNFVNLNN